MYKKIDTKVNVKTVLNNLQNEQYLVCLDSQNDDPSLSRYTIISCNPVKVIDSSTTDVKQILSQFDSIYQTNNELESLPFCGGYIGALSYHLLENFYQVELKHNNKLPKIIGGIYEQGIVIDHLNDVSHLFNLNGDIKHLEQALLEKENPDLSAGKSINDIALNIEKSEYEKQIAKIKNYIKSGDVYELNFTANYAGSNNKDGLEMFYNLKADNPAPFAAYLSFDDLKIVSTSPELFFNLENNQIFTQPMKGTIARCADKMKDRENLRILKSSEKDKSELRMIIDLMRNDLSKICKSNSVKVENPFQIKEYPSVYQQVSDVLGVIRDEIRISEIIEALFPSGSITGAPKLRSIEVIDELENYSREFYTGSIGMISYNQKSCFNVAIRTIIINNEAVNYSVGGAVVWDSTASGEFAELKLKAKAMTNALK